jgi:hypothetical protein
MGAPRSDGPAADEVTAAEAQAGPAAVLAAARVKGRSRRPVEAPAGLEDALSLYRDLFDKAKWVPSLSVAPALSADLCCGRGQLLTSGKRFHIDLTRTAAASDVAALAFAEHELPC